MISQPDTVCATGLNTAQERPTSLFLAATTLEQENAHLRLALNELRHRTSNQWQFLMGMAELERIQQTQTASSDASVHLCSLIYAFAALNDTLDVDVAILTGSHEINVRPLLEGLLARLQATMQEDKNLSCTVQDARLAEKSCAALLLICAELVCNAVKYGMKSTQVTFHTEAAQGKLEVYDDGPGFPADFCIADQSQQGLQLVESFCRFDLNGVMRCHSTEQGGVVTLTFPVASVREGPAADAADKGYEAFCAMEGITCFDALPG